MKTKKNVSKAKKKSINKDLYIGKKVYVDSSYYMSHGSDDFTGGLATVSKISKSTSGGEPCTFIEIKERPGHGYNWDQFLAKEQTKLKKNLVKEKLIHHLI